MPTNALTNNDTLIRILESWTTTENPMNSTAELIEWINEKNKSVNVNIDKIDYAYDDERSWYYDPIKGEIRNPSRTFFQIPGLQMVSSADKEILLREQPIILQKEIGYLGIIGKVIDGVLYFLMQAKIEPGNVNKVQISPTIQATKSNFMQTHGGKVPAYLDYFSNKRQHEIVVDQIQSEQSSRFLGKRNRNIIIVTDEDIAPLDAHRWMTLGQIKQLMAYDNLVNMDTRTVISCIPFSLRDFSYKELGYIRSLYKDEALFNSMFFGNDTEINNIYQYLNEVKMFNGTEVAITDLKALNSWKFENGEFLPKDNKGDFKIVYCDIEIEGREVNRWQQPLLEAVESSIFGLAFRNVSDKTEFLVRAKTEVGCFDFVELGPTVQLSPLDDSNASLIDSIFVKLMAEHPEKVCFEGLFSEEGGRFYQEQNKNVLLRTDSGDFPDPLPEGYFWVDYHTLNILIQFNNCLNIQLRNLLSIIKI